MLRGIVSNDGKEITRIPMRAGDEYKEGWEVRDLQNKLIWGRRDPFQSNTASVPFKGYGLTAKIESITGNIHQDGIPSYDNPIEVQMVGDRTENLYAWPYASTWGVDGTGQNRTVYNSQYTRSSVVKLKPNTQYTISAKAAGSNDTYCRIAIFDEEPQIGSVSTHYYFSSNDGSTTFTTGANEEWGIVVQNNVAAASIDLKRMLNEGTAPPPYEPYGYKIKVLPLGKNLCPPFETYMDGYISSYGGIVEPDANYKEVYTDFIEVNPSNSYAFSFGESGGAFPSGSTVNGWRAIGCYDSDKNFIVRYGGSGIAPFYRKIGELPNNTRYVRLTCRTFGKTKSMQLELGTIATSYEPYRPPIYLPTPLAPGEVLRSDGTRDVKWGIIHDYGNFIYNDSDSTRTIIRTTAPDFGSNRFYCTHTVEDASTEDIRAVIATVYSTLYISVPYRLTGATESDSDNDKKLKTIEYLNDIGMKIYYQLATPTTEKLDPLPLIPTTEGANTITIDTKVPPSEVTIKVHARKIHYGFKIDKTVSNSENAVIYTHDAVTMTPAYMDYSADRFNYGSWENSFFVRDCYPVALNLDGTEAYRLDPNDYTKKSDGTPSDIFYELLSEEPSDWSTQWKQYYTKSGNDYTLNDQTAAPEFTADTYYRLTYNESFTGNFMVAFPKVWFYRHEDAQYNYIEISNQKLSDDWKCYAHINEDGQEVDFIYLPIFKGIIKDSKLRSLPGQIPQGSTTATTEIDAATALGKRWQIWDHSSVECLNDLLTLMSKSIDSQGRFGQGRSSGYNAADTVTYGKLQTGTLLNKGKFHGYNAATKEVKVFGIEGYWSNRYDRLQGMLLVDNVWKIKMTPPYNLIGTDFVTLSDAEVPTGNGYPSKMQTSEYGSIPASIAGGSASLYYKDYFYKTATGTRVAFRGGACLSGTNCGFRFVYVGYAASASAWNIGASPIYK